MRETHLIDNERGIALITVLLVALVVGVFSVAAALIGTNSGLINRYQERQNTLDAVADAGVELARSMLNANPALYPANGYATLENGVAVTDASGAVIPGITRSLYAGPTGITSGQFGVFGSVVAVTTDGFGNTVVRRGEIVQQSFARYAYFTNNEGAIRFGAGDQLWGPVHSNSSIGLWNGPPNPSATFFDQVTVATGQTVVNAGAGLFMQGPPPALVVPPVPMPTLANLNALQVQAQAGNTSFNGSGTGAPGAATTRIEFIAIDLNADGQVTGDNEGFMRVYQCLNLADNNCALWVAAKVPGGGMDDSENCGHYHTDPPFAPLPPLFVSANAHPLEPNADSWSDALVTPSRRCYLGGADELWGGFQAADAMGQWLQWPGGVPGAIAGRPDAQYLFPITRAFNPNFKGVVYVNGNVVVSGVVRSRVTLAATGNIVVADDVVYAGAGNCNDILGLFAGGSIVVSDNTINTPTILGGIYRSYDDTRDEFIQAIVLTLNIFTAENFAGGPDNNPPGEPCGGQAWGRGCLFLTGGVIQQTRGGVGTTGGTGYVKRYTYNQCGASNPPPYFPTTGYFDRGRYYEVNPVGFDVATLFALLTPP